MKWCTAACERAELPRHQTHPSKLQYSLTTAWVDRAYLTGLWITVPVEHGWTWLGFVSAQPECLCLAYGPGSPDLTPELYKSPPPATRTPIFACDGRNVRDKRQYHLDLGKWISSGSQKMDENIRGHHVLLQHLLEVQFWIWQRLVELIVQNMSGCVSTFAKNYFINPLCWT